ncbi:HNH endonuclease [Serratia fonticola]|uniref:HNH endonuclease n=1 Tax=Serratia fonticola TaxID=47917 RepID=UPI00192BFBAF|nr:HNH endonuclease [Serratia fonticola]MBL5863511.1 HNH endonuclease [Serratia fonticola]
MAKLTFNALEINEMKRVYAAGHKEWDSIEVETLKPKIKAYKEEIQDSKCCYCDRSSLGEARMVLDIEHIIPKSKKIKHMFTLKNLAMSCRRCNFKKKDRVEFLSCSVDELPKRLFRSKYYMIIHPNLDEYNNHLEKICLSLGGMDLIKYKIINSSLKGRYTYSFFCLEEFEKDSFNTAQGKKVNMIKNPEIARMYNYLIESCKQ